MPIFILALLCVGYFIWSIWGRRTAQSKLNPTWNRMHKPKQCKWVAAADAGGLREFTCKTCGITAYSGDPKGPQQCKKSIGSGTL
jgi:hypothetical protein